MQKNTLKVSIYLQMLKLETIYSPHPINVFHNAKTIEMQRIEGYTANPKIIIKTIMHIYKAPFFEITKSA